jgi:hypothetical protein
MATLATNVMDGGPQLLPFRLSHDGRRREFPLKDPYYHLYCHNVRCRHLSQGDFIGRLLSLMRGTGMEVLRDGGSLDEEEAEALDYATQEAKQAIKAERQQALAAAPNLTAHEADELDSRTTELQTTEEKLSLAKYRLADDLSMPSDAVTPEIVRKYNTPGVRRIINTRRRLATRPDYMEQARLAQAAFLLGAYQAVDVLGPLNIERNFHRSNRLAYAFNIVEAAGFAPADIGGPRRVAAHTLFTQLHQRLDEPIRQHRHALCVLFGRKGLPAGGDGPAQWTDKAFLAFLNGLLDSTLGLKIKGDRRQTYALVDAYAELLGGPGQPPHPGWPPLAPPA